MIYTITLNPAIDYYVEIDKFHEKTLNLVNNAYSIVGGKGINVSKVLHNFKQDSISLGFIGGYTGEHIRTNYKTLNMKEKFTTLKQDTRINIKMKTNFGETEVAGKSPKITEENLQDFFKEISKIKSGDKLVLSGSVPESLKTNIYVEIIEKIPKNVDIILDTRGEAFDFALQKGVYLTKPNQKELEDFLGKNINNLDDLVTAAKELQAKGSKNVIVSLGEKGSLCITRNKVLLGNAPKGKLVSSVGAGDSMVAGLLYGLELGKNIEEAYSYAIASGSSTAFSEGLTNLEDMMRYKEQVLVEEYK
ncbi:MAG: 1-phosphofructokinase [Fusobacteriales bacterium]|nr:MAG: 1-phosphofructokinase [Fusobacteriales bacterium]